MSFDGIHIVNAAPRKKRSNTRLVSGPFFADVVSDTRSDPPIHHWIVQRQGSPELIQWGQEYTFEEAESQANACLQALAEQETRKSGD